MLTWRPILWCGLCAGLLLCSCGKTPESPGLHPHALGGTEYGAPIAPARADIGILGDQTTYQPASFTPGGGAGGPAGPGAVAGADAATAARQLVNNMLDDLQSGEVAYVLEAISPNQIELVRDDDDFLYNTQQAFGFLTNALDTAYGSSSVEQLHADLRKLITDDLTIEAVSADTVTVTPNPLLVVLGPEKATPALTIAHVGGEWKVRLDAPLTEEDLAAIRQYHEKLQEALYWLGEALENGEIADREEVYTALVQAGQGQEINLAPTGEGEPDEGASEPAEGEPASPDEPGKPGDIRPVGP